MNMTADEKQAALATKAQTMLASLRETIGEVAGDLKGAPQVRVVVPKSLWPWDDVDEMEFADGSGGAFKYVRSR